MENPSIEYPTLITRMRSKSSIPKIERQPSSEHMATTFKSSSN